MNDVRRGVARIAAKPVAALAGSVLAAAVLAAAPAFGEAAPRQIAIRDVGGLEVGASVLTVTTLADSGPGSLRQAVATRGPRVVVFAVSGYVDLTSDVTVRQPGLTIAGQTAPTPGVVLRGGGLVIRTHDVVVEHLGVYPGSSGRPEVDVKRDAISVVSIPGKDRNVHDVVLRNVSAGWATDENVSFAGGGTARTRLELSIVAEGLRFSTHPVNQRKVPPGHSMGMLAGPSAKDAVIVGNLFVSNNRRNPLIYGGTEAVVHNNVFLNPGLSTTHLAYRDRDPVTLSYTDNLMVPGRDTGCEEHMIELPRKRVPNAQGSIVFVAGNSVAPGRDGPSCPLGVASPTLDGFASATNPLRAADWTDIPVADLEAALGARSGMRPRDRHPIDRRILAGGTAQGRLIDDPQDVGGWPPVESLHADVPPPLSIGSIADDAQLAIVRRTLCGRHFDVGGSAHRGCPSPAD